MNPKQGGVNWPRAAEYSSATTTATAKLTVAPPTPEFRGGEIGGSGSIAPVGEKHDYVTRALTHITPYLPGQRASA